MPDAKSLLPGRAFRSEHAQLRPEPHSIASHGPDPMDPLQTTRMRNGVLYAAEWPCCHDPLRLSLGSEDPFNTRTRVAPHRALPPRGWCDGCGAARASPACGEARRTRTLARGLWVSLQNQPTQPKHLASARGSFRPRPRRAACASCAWALILMCADHRELSRRARGARAPCRSPHPAPQKAGGRGPPTPHTLTHQCRTAMHRPPPTNYQCPNQEHLETHQSRPTRVHYVSLPLPLGAARLHTLTPAHSPSSTPTCCTSIAPM